MKRPGEIFHLTAGDRVHDEAARWHARRLDRLDAEDARAFRQWLEARPEHADAYREVERLWDGSRVAAGHPDVMAAAMRALGEAPPSQQGGAWRAVRQPRWMAVAAAVLVAALTIGGWHVLSGHGSRFATAIGERRIVRLDDGSVITMDTDTVLYQRYDAHERRIDLVQGRAEFRDVADPQGRPFVVHAAGGTVRAIGTDFQVGVTDSQARVVLLQGLVAVTPASVDDRPAAAILKPSEAITFRDTGHLGAVETADVKVARGWTQGRLFVDNWRLRDLVAEMNRYSKKPIKLGDASLGDIRISGVFHTGDQDSLVMSLQQGWHIEARQDAHHEVVLYRR